MTTEQYIESHERARKAFDEYIEAVSKAVASWAAAFKVKVKK